MRMGTRALQGFVLSVMCVLAVVSVGRVLTKGPEEHAYDWHCHWYANHFLWHGQDPYLAGFEDRKVDWTVHYLDGPTVSGSEVAQFEWYLPTVTAPLMLLLALLSRFSWPVAVWGWIIINLASCVMIAVCLARSLARRFVSASGLLILATLGALIATRETIELGQTSLFVLACMLAGLLLSERHPVLAGVLLGISLSKYSVTLPGLIVFVYQRRYKSIVVAAGVQVIALLLISALAHTTPWAMALLWLRILTQHAESPGMHLAATVLVGFGALRWKLVAAGSLILLAVLVHWWRTRRASGYQHLARTGMHLAAVLMLWNLASLYHRRYDNVGAILGLAILTDLLVSRPLGGDARDSAWTSIVTVGERLVVGAITALVAAIWILPIYVLLGDDAYRSAFAVSNLLALGTVLWLLFRQFPANTSYVSEAAVCGSSS